MICPNCGTPTKTDHDEFCAKCGAAITSEDPMTLPHEAEPSKQDANSDEQTDTPVKKKKTWLVVLLIVLAILVLPIVLVVIVVLVLALLSVLGVLTVFVTAPKEATPLTPVTPTTVPYTEEYPVTEGAPILEITTVPVTTTTAAPAVMPSCDGWDVEFAKSRLESLGCTVVVVQAYSDLAENSVISQSPAAGTTLYGGDEVVLYISEGPEYKQKVVVSAPEGSSYGTMTLYNWANGEWEVQFSCAASVGQNGIGTDYGEGKGISPEGVFKIGVALAASGVETYDWPVERVTLDTCIVDDVNSEHYNTIQSIRSLPDGVHYDTIGNTLINGFSEVCIFVEHNGNGYTSDGVVAGKGSVITICSKSSALEPTAGCVDISTADMNALLRILDTAKNPHIEFTAQ